MSNDGGGTIVKKEMNQSQMLDDILSKINLLIENWNPRFVIDEETKIISLNILNNLKKSKVILESIILPRSDLKMIKEYYNKILELLKKIETKESLTTFGGDVWLEPISIQILEKVMNWSNLSH